MRTAQEDIELIRLLELQQKDSARNHYDEYCKYVHNGRWILGNHLKLVCDNIEALINRTMPQNILIISMPPQHGKLCSDDTPVLTVDGWKTHGDISIGDHVFNRDGNPARVTDVLNKGNMADYEVEFTDGEKIKVHGQHEWVVYDRSKNKELIIETQQIHAYKYWYADGNKKRCRFQVDENKCIKFRTAELPVEPYIFGAWLGDGHTTKSTINHAPTDMEVVEKIKAYGYEPTSTMTHPATGVLTTYFYGELYQKFKSMGFANIKGNAKHIPDIFKTSGVDQRLELLAGLIDTDGYVYQKNGRVTFSNANKTLIYDVNDICVSLGFRTTICEYKPVMSTSDIKGKQTIYQLCFNPDMQIPTAIPRKKITKMTPMKRKRGIKSIIKINPVKGKCITVEGGVYLVGKTLIPTHNSQCVTETLPSYYLGKFPRKRVIEISYGDDLAQRFGRRNKEKILEYGKDLFNIELSKVSDTDFEVKTHKGSMISKGVMAGLTGNPGDLIIIDDPIKNKQESESETYRNRVWEEFLNSIYTRLSADGVIVLIMTRWHEDDLAGRLLRYMPDKCKEINIPLEAEENDILGRNVGDSLFPQIGKDNAWLKEFKKVYTTQEGSRSWTSLMQGRPTAMEGNMIKREWWKYYTQMPNKFDTLIQSWDMTFKDTDGSDFVVGQVWGSFGADIYLIDQTRARMDFPTTIQAVLDMTKKYPKATTKLVEDKANGTAVIAMLRHKIGGIIAIVPKESKQARVSAISPLIEAGNVHLPMNAVFTNGFVEECSSFPSGAHDDQVDCMSQSLTRFMYVREHSPKYEIPDDLPEDLKNDLLSDPAALQHWMAERNRL